MSSGVTSMPIRVRSIDGIIPGIGVAVDVDAGEDGVPAVGGEEAGEIGVVIAGVEILQASFRVEALADIGLAAQHRGAIGGEWLAVRPIVVDAGGGGTHDRHPPGGGEVILVGPGCDGGFALYIRMEPGGEEAGIIADIGIEQHLGLATQIAGGERDEGLGGPLAIGAIG